MGGPEIESRYGITIFLFSKGPDRLWGPASLLFKGDRGMKVYSDKPLSNSRSGNHEVGFSLSEGKIETREKNPGRPV